MATARSSPTSCAQPCSTALLTGRRAPASPPTRRGTTAPPSTRRVRAAHPPFRLDLSAAKSLRASSCETRMRVACMLAYRLRRAASPTRRCSTALHSTWRARAAPSRILLDLSAARRLRASSGAHSRRRRMHFASLCRFHKNFFALRVTASGTRHTCCTKLLVEERTG